MKALHFGAGNIGRGFIGMILRDNGYEVTFADIADNLINEINAKGEYTVIFADPDMQSKKVTGVKAVHNIKEPDRLKQLIREADLITTAVGPNIVPLIAKTILPGIREKLAQDTVKFLNIIACENAIGATDILKEALFDLLNAEEREKAEMYIGFPNSAVDRIVPAQNNPNMLDVKVEPFYEWVIDESKMKGTLPKLEGVHFVEDLLPYIERKLFTVNTGHAATAYLGLMKGYATVHEAIMDPEVEKMVRGVLSETSRYITGHYGFDEKEHQQYVDTIIGRFKNVDISDDLERVGRSPLRKISKADRFVNPALRLIEMGEEPVYLAQAIAAALRFRNENDKESLELTEYIEAKGVEEALVKYSGLEKGSKLISLVAAAYTKNT